MIKTPLFVVVSLAIYIANVFRPYPAFLEGAAKVFWFDVLLLGVIATVSIIFSLSSYHKLRLVNTVVAISLAAILIMVSFNSPDVTYTTHLLRITYFILFTVFIIVPWVICDALFYDRITRFLVISIVPMGVIFALQMFPLPVISDFIYFVFGDEKLRPYTSSSPRVYGSLFNANWAGVYLLACWVSLMSLASQRLVNLRTVIMLTALLIVMTIFTGSRTAVFGIVIALAWFWLMNIIAIRSWVGLLRHTVAIGFVLGLISLLWVAGDRVPGFGRFTEMWASGSLEDVESVTGRIMTWHDGFEQFLTSPWVGPGVEGITHNSFITWLQAFGIIGALLLVGIIMCLFWRWLTLGVTKEMIVSSSVLLGFSVMSLTAEFFFTTQLMLLVLPLIVGVLFMPKRNAESQNLYPKSNRT